MARVTVEDCIVQVPNRFDLVMLAAQRAREIVAGAPLTLERDDDKNPVVALREIAEETVDLENLNNSIVQGLQKHVEMDEAEDEPVEFDLSGLTIGAEGVEDGAEAQAKAAEGEANDDAGDAPGEAAVDASGDAGVDAEGDGSEDDKA